MNEKCQEGAEGKRQEDLEQRNKGPPPFRGRQMWKWTTYRNPRKKSHSESRREAKLLSHDVRPTEGAFQERGSTGRCRMLQRGQLR